MENRILSEEKLYELAKRKVIKIRDFYISLACYCIVIPGLTVLNLLVCLPDFYWFLFPTLGWGIGLLFQWFGTIGGTPFLGPEWEEKKINELMEKDNFK